jgi:ADP-heptose:LPS heptosyltransferase
MSTDILRAVPAVRESETSAFSQLSAGNPGDVGVVFALRALGIGDLLTGLPALRGLTAAFPGDRVVLAVPAWLRPLAQLARVADSITPVPGLDPAGLAGFGEPVGIAVNLHGRGPQSHEVLRSLRPQRLLAFRCETAGHLDGPDWRADEHEVDRWCRLLAFYGIDTDPTDLDLRTPPLPPKLRGLTVVHPGAKDPRRRWPVRRFAQVARRLRADGHRVVVTGSPQDRAMTSAVVRAAGLPPGVDLGGRLSLVQLAAVVGQARLVVSNDTGVAHLATAVRTPSVTIFAAMDPALWGPPQRAYHRVVWHPEEAKVSAHAALDSISVGEVLAAAAAV